MTQPAYPLQTVYGEAGPLDWLCLAPHPDDAEIGAGGTLIRLARAGQAVGILELTRGERGTQGTPEQRQAECVDAAHIMGLRWRGQLGLPDGELADTPPFAHALAAALRTVRPRVLVVPHHQDRHPDHFGTYHLTKRAIHLAALNPYMCRVAGEVADGLRPHPVCTPRYINEVMRPAYADGLERAGRGAVTPFIAMKPLVASGRDEEALEKKIRDVRARVAFYASTPAYRPAFEIWGLGDLADKLSVLSREQRWEEMPAYVDDEMLNTYAVVGTYDQIADKIVERFSGVLTDVGFSIAVENDEDAATMRGILKKVRAASAQ